MLTRLHAQIMRQQAPGHVKAQVLFASLCGHFASVVGLCLFVIICSLMAVYYRVQEVLNSLHLSSLQRSLF